MPFHVCGLCGLNLHPTTRPCGERNFDKMNSEQRREARYRRRKAKREARKQKRSEEVGSLSDIFRYDALYRYGKQCCRGVRWKNSTQRFELHLFSTTARIRRNLLDGTWRPAKYAHFTLCERGKVRPIDAPRIQDRQVHKTITKRVFLPLYLPDMIHNNGASLEGKGFHFSLKMLKRDLVRHFRRYGREGHVILMDFEKFFPSAPHKAVYARHRRLLRDTRVRMLADRIVGFTDGDRGLPLGVEVSQIEMIGLPSPLDNYIKCQLGIKGMGHYMDDYYILIPPDQDPREVLAKVVVKAREVGFSVSLAKTQVRPLSRPLRYCKAKFTLSETGRVAINGSRDSIKRARRKIRAFRAKLTAGEMTFEDVRTSVQSSLAYFGGYDDHGRVLRLRRLFYAIYGFSADDNQNFKQGDTA